MAVRKIETELALTGEKQFNDQMKAVNSNLKTLKSEMALVSSEFEGQANSAEALRAKQKVLNDQYDQQKEKVKALEAQLEKARDAYGDNSSQVDKYQQQVNAAKVQLNKFGRELEDTNRYLEEAEKSADGAADSIDEFGKQVKDAGDKADAAGGESGLGGFVATLGEMKGMLVGGAIVAGAKELAGAIIDIVDESQEYLSIMGSLEVSSAEAGYTTEQTAEAYKTLYGVLADTQSSATTLANLQAIGLEQDELMTTIEACIGAWSRYGDSIPIDGLSEAINETIQTGTVTGTFADVLNWAGQSEDAFNEKLAACNSTSERTQAVLDVLSQENLPELGQTWQETNEALVSYNQAQADMEEANAQLAETLQPVATWLKTEYAGAISLVASTIQTVIDKIKEWNNTKIAQASTISAQLAAAREEAKKNGTKTGVYQAVSGSHAAGLDYVPFDGYIAELHRGERVLTAQEARSSATVINGGGGAIAAQPSSVNVTLELDGAVLARKQVFLNRDASEKAGISFIQ